MVLVTSRGSLCDDDHEFEHAELKLDMTLLSQGLKDPKLLVWSIVMADSLYQ